MLILLPHQPASIIQYANQSTGVFLIVFIPRFLIHE